VTHPVSGVVCDILSAQVTAEKDSVVLKSAFVGGGLTDVIFVENLDTPRIRSSVWLLRIPVTTEKDSVVFKKCVCEGLLTH